MSKVTDFLNRIFSSTETYTRPEKKGYTTRGVNLTDEDMEELRRIIFSEVSNRPIDKQELEARVIANTALNRVNEFARNKKPKTLKEVLIQPNQYQGYQSPLYQRYDSPQDEPTKQRKSNIDIISNKLLDEIKADNFQDNTEGAFYYQHKGDKIYYDKDRPLFAEKRFRSEPLFVNR